jgi:hypothetical protein
MGSLDGGPKGVCGHLLLLLAGGGEGGAGLGGLAVRQIERGRRLRGEGSADGGVRDCPSPCPLSRVSRSERNEDISSVTLRSAWRPNITEFSLHLTVAQISEENSRNSGPEKSGTVRQAPRWGSLDMG